MKFKIGILLAFLASTQAFAGVARTLDGATITNGAAVLTLPTSSGSLADTSSAQTLTNKSISGASNTFTLIPTASVVNLSGTNSGDVTIGTGNGLSLSGQALSLGLATGSVAGALSAADWTTFNGKLTSPLTTKGDLLAFSSVHGRLPVGTDTFVLTADSTSTFGVKWAAVPTTAPSLNGGSASPESVTAAGGVTLSSISNTNLVWVIGSPGAVTVTATPSITACTADGQMLKVIGTDATKTVTLQDNAGLAGSNLQLNGTWVGGLYSVLSLHCDITLGMWVEDSRR